MSIGQLLTPKLARVCLSELESGELFCFPDASIVYLVTDERDAEGHQCCVCLAEHGEGELVAYPVDSFVNPVKTQRKAEFVYMSLEEFQG